MKYENMYQSGNKHAICGGHLDTSSVGTERTQSLTDTESSRHEKNWILNQGVDMKAGGTPGRISQHEFCHKSQWV